jgi:isocitrate dehydrogenase kinase/phosphatase
VIGRRGRFADVIRRQLDGFEHDHADVIEEVRQRLEAYNRASRDEAEELYGDYLDAVETGTELLADLRDHYARALDEPLDERYRREFDDTVAKRLAPFRLELENR